MVTATVSEASRRSAGDRLTRVLAWGLVVTSVADFLMGFGLAAEEEPTSSVYPMMTVVNVIQHLLMLGGIYAVLRAGAGGAGRLSKIGFSVAILGVIVLSVAEPVSSINVRSRSRPPCP